MIAEINSQLQSGLCFNGRIKAFVTGDPDQGTLVEPNLLLGSRDRVAIDAVGVAVLKSTV